MFSHCLDLARVFPSVDGVITSVLLDIRPTRLTLVNSCNTCVTIMQLSLRFIKKKLGFELILTYETLPDTFVQK